MLSWHAMSTSQSNNLELFFLEIWNRSRVAILARGVGGELNKGANQCAENQ